jgi:MFS transporter, DHA2 family, multidrug resistance protein
LLPSTFLQSIGQSFALSGVVFFGILHVRREDALTFGAVLQTARLMGGEIGSAFISTLARVREQVASNLIGQHVQMGDPEVLRRVKAYGAVTTRVIDPVGAITRGELVLGNVVREAATTQAIIDSFLVIGVLTAVALLIVALRAAAPEGPASPTPLFRLRGSSPP